jgi:hypothetical protein
MKGDFHVRFRENVGVKFPRVTRLCATKMKLLLTICIIMLSVFQSYSQTMDNNDLHRTAEELQKNQIISANLLNKIKGDIASGSIDDKQKLFEALVELAFDELPANSKEVYSSDSPGFYYAMPALTTHVKIPKQYKVVVRGLYKKGIIDDEGKKQFDKFLSTPSASVDHLVIMKAFNYKFLQMITDHIRKK